MSRRLWLPVVLVLPAVMLAALFFFPAQNARAPAREASASQVAATTGVADGFQDRLVTDAPGATALAFLPDGRLLVSDRSGRVLVRRPGEAGTTEALDIRGSVCSNSERGLLGIAVGPDFKDSGYVYLYYTHKKYGVCPEKEPQQDNNPVNRVSRFKMTGGDIARGSERVLINNIPSPNGNHNAGDLHFGKDGKLYVSTGDGACNYASPTRCQPDNGVSRYRNVLNGKILRVNADGTVPGDNPYAGSDRGVRCATLTNNKAAGGSVAPAGTLCKETYAWGFRNPFRFAMNPDAAQTSFRVNDVGGGYREEISSGKRGADYGWNCFEGTRTNSNTGKCRPLPDAEKPIHQYSHSGGCSSITGGAFVPNGAGWPASYRDAYLFGDYVCGRIFALKPKSGGGFTRTVFANVPQGGPVSFAFGPDGALYYTTYSGDGQVRRIAFVNNGSPIADLQTTPSDAGKTFGPTPLTVNFDASGTTDPENDTMTYKWDFDGDGVEDETGTTPTAEHTYNTARAYTAALTVEDSRGNIDTAKTTVYAGNDGPPRPEIESPGSGALFEVDEPIRLSGSASADSDGPVALTWEVIRHHTAPNAHEHAYDTFEGPTALFEAPGPEDLLSTNPQGNFLEVRLTATDAQGLSQTVSRDVKPETTTVRFATEPSRLYLGVNGERVRAPRTLLVWVGSNLNVYAPPQKQGGRVYAFRSWSDGAGGARRAITVGPEYKKYTAAFKRR